MPEEALEALKILKDNGYSVVPARLVFDEPAADSVDAAPWVGVDLDNTLAEFDVFRGWDHVGAPIPNAVDLVKDLLQQGRAVKIFTARVAPNAEGKDHIPIARAAIEAWTAMVFGRALPATSQKDVYCTRIVDDIAAPPPLKPSIAFTDSAPVFEDTEQ